MKDWKVSKISEQFMVEFRAEAFNVLNHPSLQPTFPANPATGQVFAGTSVSPSAGRIIQTSSAPRIFQLAMKIVF